MDVRQIEAKGGLPLDPRVSLHAATMIRADTRPFDGTLA